MKKTTAILSIMMISLFLLSGTLSAQNGNGNMKGMRMNKQINSNCQKSSFQNIPNITDTQKEQLTKKRTAMMKEVLPIRNSLKEKMAHLNTLNTATEIDTKAINKQIESIGKDKIAMMKIRAKFHQEVRSILTDDQRVYFDTHHNKMMNKGHQGMMMRHRNCN